MPKLSSFGIKTVAVSEPIRFVGEPKLSNLEKSREGQSYYEWALAKPVTVRCSMDKSNEIPEYQTESLFVREDLLDSDLWEQDEVGMYIPDYVADHSINHMQPLFLEETIRQWSKGNADIRKDNRRLSNIETIRARAAKLAVNTPVSVAGAAAPARAARSRRS